MKKFRVYLTVQDYGWVEVEAENAKQAEELAEQEEQNGNVYWSRHDVIDIKAGEELIA